MSILLSPTAIRALLLAAILACAAALTAPSARGETVDASHATRDTSKAALASCASCVVSSAPRLVLAEEFTWRQFIKYWSRQAGSLQGVVGTVLLVAAVAVLIILSKGRGS
jgi:hypothetical protein